jgi:SAM-dependent methyltransferase
MAAVYDRGTGGRRPRATGAAPVPFRPVRHDDPDYGRRFAAADRARAFGGVAAAYDRARPGYPAPAVRFAVGRADGTVLDLGAGTGKLTRTVASLGYATIAVEPDDAMRALLADSLPSARALRGSAEEIPVEDASVDAVLVGQAWHWFDHARAAAELRRIVRPGGSVALLYNTRDERVPWVARFAAATGESFGTGTEEPQFDGVRGEPGFGPVEHRLFEHDERLTSADLQALASSFSFVALLPDAERRTLLARVAELAREAADADGLLTLPYRLMVARAVVGIS